ncbi:hypothetical protein HZS_6195 [Henneguya salminicola]|nr:hypothetical protein HZS_6195 [Henneguya salminicola]
MKTMSINKLLLILIYLMKHEINTVPTFIHFTTKGEYVYGLQRKKNLNGPCRILNIINLAKYSLTCLIDGYKTLEEKIFFFNNKFVLSASNNISFSILINIVRISINRLNFTLNSLILYVNKETFHYQSNSYFQLSKQNYKFINFNNLRKKGKISQTNNYNESKIVLRELLDQIYNKNSCLNSGTCYIVYFYYNIKEV